MDRKNRQSLCPSKVEDAKDPSETTIKWEEFVKELKRQWKIMWQERIDDRVRAEGIAKENYPSLFLERGTIVVATRKYKPPDFVEILERHCSLIEIERKVGNANPFVGGWGKFIRNVLNKQQRYTKRMRPDPPKSKDQDNLQKKKGGRGWVHRL